MFFKVELGNEFLKNKKIPNVDFGSLQAKSSIDFKARRRSHPLNIVVLIVNDPQSSENIGILNYLFSENISTVRTINKIVISIG